MKSLLLQLLLCAFGTALLLYSVIEYEPPAFIGYVFGFFNGTAWIGLIALRLIRSKSND